MSSTTCGTRVLSSRRCHFQLMVSSPSHQVAPQSSAEIPMTGLMNHGTPKFFVEKGDAESGGSKAAKMTKPQKIKYIAAWNGYLNGLKFAFSIHSRLESR